MVAGLSLLVAHFMPYLTFEVSFIGVSYELNQNSVELPVACCALGANSF